MNLQTLKKAYVPIMSLLINMRRYSDTYNCYAPNCTELNCNRLNLYSVPQNLSKNVEYLQLGNNFISTISNHTFKRYTNLKYINLMENNITDIEERSFDYLNELKFLYLSNNKLKKFDQRFPMMYYLDLSINPLQHVNIRDSVVYAISIMDTKVENFSHVQLPHSLAGLVTDNTNVKTISVENIAPLCNLQSLRFNGKLSKACDCVHFKKWISRLMLGDKCSETHCTEDELKLSDKAKKLRSECTQTTEKRCLYSPSYSQIMANCSDLYLNDVPRTLKSDIMALNLRKNFIERLEKSAFKNYTRMLSLDLSYNQINFIDFDAFRDLQLVNLNLEGNRIKYFQPHNLSSLFLTIGYNPLKTLNIYSSNVKILNLTATKLTYFPVLNSYLSHLDLSETELSISVKEVQHLSKLKQFVFTTASNDYKNNCQCLGLTKWMKDRVPNFRMFTCSSIICPEEESQFVRKSKISLNFIEMQWLLVNILSYLIGLYLMNEKVFFFIFIGVKFLTTFIRFLMILIT